MSNEEQFGSGKNCNSTTTIKGILKKWWDEVKKVDLKASQLYVADLAHFGPMAAAEAKGFACSTKLCSGSKSDLLCVYDKVLTTNDDIYTAGASADKICEVCNQNKLCTDYLCQYTYTPAAEMPPRACDADKLTTDLENVAINMHNYYRRLSATGWAEDKIDGYAPTAKKLPALAYDCAGIGAKSYAKATNCPNTAPAADAGYSLNYYYVQEYETPKTVLFERDYQQKD
ncbi:hypothetical protein ANCCAN_06747 [Ancylostoma caninum]|uniref:SCP domain-containing protein n=1 Tax=Ancylostoma caninum TaxID=29170 RepID=A0A368GVX7_ANCCA|nr:hypothetical protein ANCCAN_06747 [Ancylostoma caninum]